MAAIIPSRLVLLDLQDEYGNFGTIFRSQLFCRFTDRARCLAYISNHRTNIRLLHFFIPKSEHVVVDADIVLFNTIYYIYCMNEAGINEMRRQYNFPMYVKIFDVESLSTYLRQAAIGILSERAERTRHEPDEHDIALQLAAELADTLGDELRQHMNGRIGEQPNDN
ncbi:unnamed protein product [Adineta steineri]|uniref:Uncharacterized protein n=1 Tax=Adineta steineri TaxID=433720 RepID=A0A819YIW5_9BILA|nr:unnamed protein product [Adineta steineri]CAF4160480.1 unnamed protein product [Adineta steineri]